MSCPVLGLHLSDSMHTLDVAKVMHTSYTLLQTHFTLTICSSSGADAVALLVIHRLQVQVLTEHHPVVALINLLTPVWLCHQAV